MVHDATMRSTSPSELFEVPRTNRTRHNLVVHRGTTLM